MIALRVANDFIMRLSLCPDDTILAEKEAQGQSVIIEAFNLQTQQREGLEVFDLHHERDGWNVDHLVGTIFGQDRLVSVAFLDNEAEADPLSLR